MDKDKKEPAVISGPVVPEKTVEAQAFEARGEKGDLHKVVPSGTKDKMYSGVVTVTGESGEYHQKISARIDLGPTPRGYDYVLNHAFRAHYPSANFSAGIKIDETNTDDPMLRTEKD